MALRFAMLRYVILRYTMFYAIYVCVPLRYVSLCDARRVALRLLRYAVLRFVFLRHVPSRNVSLRYVSLCSTVSSRLHSAGRAIRCGAALRNAAVCALPRGQPCGGHAQYRDPENAEYSLIKRLLREAIALHSNTYYGGP